MLFQFSRLAPRKHVFSDINCECFLAVAHLSFTYYTTPLEATFCRNEGVCPSGKLKKTRKTVTRGRFFKKSEMWVHASFFYMQHVNRSLSLDLRVFYMQHINRSLSLDYAKYFICSMLIVLCLLTCEFFICRHLTVLCLLTMLVFLYSAYWSFFVSWPASFLYAAY